MRLRISILVIIVSVLLAFNYFSLSVIGIKNTEDKSNLLSGTSSENYSNVIFKEEVNSIDRETNRLKNIVYGLDLASISAIIYLIYKTVKVNDNDSIDLEPRRGTFV